MVTTTTTYSFKKPTVGQDEDVWGGYLNDSMDLIDDVLDGTTPVTGIDINSGTIDNAVIGGTTAVAGTFSTLTANTSLSVTGNIIVSGTVDGRDVASDGSKLDGIESGATADQTASEILTAIKTVDGSGSGLDADLWDGNQFSSYLNQAVLTSSTPTFNNLNVAGYIAHVSDGDTYMNFGTDTISLYSGGSNRLIVDNSGVRLGDTGNGYFQPVSGNYGSVQIDGGGHGGWEGYSIGGRAVFLHNNTASMGLFDDVNDHWALSHTFNGTTQLYYDGSPKLDTTSSGVSINGSLFTDGSNKEDYDALSGTTPTCNTANAGAFSLTMTGNTTFTFSATDAASGWSQGFILELTGNGSTVTWPTSVDWAGGTAPDAPASGETDIYVFWTRDGGTTWYGVQSIDAAA
jgi:hypothetical protein